MNGHDVLIRILHAERVETVFGLVSEDTLHLAATLDREWGDRIHLVDTRHEQGAMAMADGYARARDGIGVCLVGRGPAIAQTGNAMVTARKKGSDLLVVVPETPLSADHDIKSFDQESYLRSTIGTVVSIRSEEQLVPGFRDAIRRVKSGDGPLAVQVPWDLLDSEVAVPEEVDLQDGVTPETGASTARLHPDSRLVDEAAELYVESDAYQPPVLIAGRGAVEADAKEAIEALAERTSALLATTLQGRNYFAEHPYSLGFIGKWGSQLANQYASESSLVIAFGASLNPYTTDEGHVFGDDTRVVHVDRDSTSIGRYTEVDLGIQGDARVTAEALDEELARRGIDRAGELWTDQLRTEIDEHTTIEDRTFPDVPGTIDPRDLVRSLNDLLPEDRRVVTDAGHFTRWVMDGVQTPPADMTFPLDFASIGLGLPMGIGTALAAEDGPCFAICGDAGLLMSIQELETAVRHDVPLTVVVMNDESLGSEYHNLEVAGIDPSSVVVSAPDFADIAASLGAEGYTVRSAEDLDDIADALRREPEGQLVVDCKINRHVQHRSKR